ncbi:hypothetical protein [Nitratireductor aquibiodomus]|uniref:hypothetical protein n=1 Tax=Nitratireductor aquibiodomus TaxID=204799 RepID=UPI001FCBF619|nr:hypothetical protein [Nitratireductor aquibiodomus]
MKIDARRDNGHLPQTIALFDHAFWGELCVPGYRISDFMKRNQTNLPISGFTAKRFLPEARCTIGKSTFIATMRFSRCSG